MIGSCPGEALQVSFVFWATLQYSWWCKWKYLFMWNSCINTKIYFWWRSWEDRAWNKEHSCLHRLCGGTEIGMFLSFLFILLGSVTSKVPVIITYQCFGVACTTDIPYALLHSEMCWCTLLLHLWFSVFRLTHGLQTRMQKLWGAKSCSWRRRKLHKEGAT